MICYIEHSFHGVLNTLPMVYGNPYPWYFDPPTRGISKALSMVYRTPIHGIANPYPWYFEPPTHGILIPLPVVFYPYQWYIEPSTHGSSNPLPMIY